MGQLKGAESLYAGFYRQFLETSREDGIKVDYEKLPRFDQIAPYLYYAGAVTRNAPGGWEIVGFVLKKPK